MHFNSRFGTHALESRPLGAHAPERTNMRVYCIHWIVHHLPHMRLMYFRIIVFILIQEKQGIKIYGVYIGRS